MDVGIIIGEATPLSWDRWKHVVDCEHDGHEIDKSPKELRHERAC